MYDYGNARIAVLRSRLLDVHDLRRLAELDSPAAILASMERSEDWRSILRETTPLFSDPQAALEASIERQRGVRLGGLIRWYDGAARSLAEALVMRLDLERVVALTRRQRGGSAAATVGASIVRGALLDVADLGAISRTSDRAGLGRILVRAGVLPPSAVRALTGDDGDQRDLEARLVAVFDDARMRRASGGGQDARTVRAILEAERGVRAVVATELQEGGPSAAWLMERSTTLASLDRVAHAGPRDPLRIGAVAGYVAAVEAQAVRLRACLARVVAGWGPEAIAPFLAGGRA